MQQSKAYLTKVYYALHDHFEKMQRENRVTDSLYYGEQGAKRLAREIGAGLADSPENERIQAITESYNVNCVQGYNNEPPIDKQTWIYHASNGLKTALTRTTLSE